MGQEVPGPFIVPPEAYNTSTYKPITQEFVVKYCNNNISIVAIPNMVHREELGIEYFLIKISINKTYVHHWPLISYCRYAKQSITQSDIRQK